MAAVQYGSIHPYNPPEWAKDLKLVPKSYVKVRINGSGVLCWYTISYHYYADQTSIDRDLVHL